MLANPPKVPEGIPEEMEGREFVGLYTDQIIVLVSISRIANTANS